MKFRIGDMRFQNHDRMGAQIMVQGVAHLARVKDFFQIEMGHLAQGVHPGIGTARAGYGDALSRKLRDRVFQRALDRSAIVLALPADKGRAVIFQGEAIARHQANCVPGAKAKPLSSSAAPMADLPAR